MRGVRQLALGFATIAMVVGATFCTLCITELNSFPVPQERSLEQEIYHTSVKRTYQNVTRDTPALDVVEGFTAPQVVVDYFAGASLDGAFPPYLHENSSKPVLGPPRTIVTNTSYEASVLEPIMPYNLTHIVRHSVNDFGYCYRNQSEWVLYDGGGNVILQLGWFVNVYYVQATNRSGTWIWDFLTASFGLNVNLEVILIIIKVPTPAFKPAIYLYPQEPLDVVVSLDVAGSIFYSDPPYPQDGWHVTAYPGGRIDGTHDYLYYDVLLDNVEVQPEGWIVSCRDFEAWCDGTLPALGLAINEIQEFANYWGTRLPGSSHIRISLLSDAFLQDNLALTVTPTPDVVIRRIFVFLPVDESASITAPSIDVPARSGFTVVEWGAIILT